VTTGRRVWVSLYGHTSPAEFAAFHTDSEPEHIVVRVIDDGAPGGPAVLSTQGVPLR
jgi:hypothetical protein